MNVKDFITDKNGKVVVFQPPNLLISTWIILTVIDFLSQGKYQVLSVMSTAVLFAWAYNELRLGDSPIRRVLGGVVLAAVILSVFMRYGR